MPYTAKQRRYFHAQAEKGKPGMAALAKEADALTKAGKEKPPVAAAKKAPAKKAAPKMPPPKKATGTKMPMKPPAKKTGGGY